MPINYVWKLTITNCTLHQKHIPNDTSQAGQHEKKNKRQNGIRCIGVVATL